MEIDCHGVCFILLLRTDLSHRRIVLCDDQVRYDEDHGKKKKTTATPADPIKVFSVRIGALNFLHIVQLSPPGCKSGQFLVMNATNG